MTATLNEPSADQAALDMYNKGMAKAQKLDLLTDTKYALCLVQLHPTVVPGDYPTLKTNIEAVTGVLEITLVVDHQTRASVPTDKKLVAVLELNLRIEDVPEEP